MILISKEATMLYISFCRAFIDLYNGLIGLFWCIVLLIICIPMFIAELLSSIFRRGGENKWL